MNLQDSYVPWRDVRAAFESVENFMLTKLKPEVTQGDRIGEFIESMLDVLRVEKLALSQKQQFIQESR